jgi:outer membrane protein TolC
LRTFAVLILSFIPLAAAHGAALDVDSAVAAARQSNPRWLQARAVAEEAAWQPLEALSGNLIKLSVSGTHLFNVKYQLVDLTLGGQAIEFPEIYPQTQLALTASWTLFDGFKTPRETSAAYLTSRAANLELERAAFQLERAVRLRFHQALAAQALAEVAEQNVRTLEDHLKRAQALLRSGEATRFDVLRIQVQLEEAIPEKQAADDAIVIARRALTESMGGEGEGRELAGKLPDPREGRVPPELVVDLSARPDLRAVALRSDAADELRGAAGAWWWPRFSLFAQLEGYNNFDASLTSNYRNDYAFGLSLSWSLFDAQAIARAGMAAARRDSAEQARRQEELRAPVDFETWKRRYGQDVALFKARSRAIESAEEALRLARSGFSAGTRTGTDVLDAEADLTRARAGLIRAQVDAEEAITNLELALGRSIGND